MISGVHSQRKGVLATMLSSIMGLHVDRYSAKKSMYHLSLAARLRSLASQQRKTFGGFS